MDQRRSLTRPSSLRMSQRKAQKVLGSLMTSLRLSPDKQTHKTRDVAKANVDVPKSPDPTQNQVAQKSTLESVIPLLSSENINDNKKGFQLLLTLTKLNKIVSSPRTNVSKRIITDDSDRTANRTRILILSFICDDVDIHATPDDDCSIISGLSDDFGALFEDSTWEDDSDSDSGTEQKAGRHWGELHCVALRVIINCLEHLSSSRTSFNEPKVLIDYSTFFWRKLVQALSKNIESGNNEDLSGCSLRCLRLLLALDSKNTLETLLKYTLLPYILNLKELGKSKNFPTVHDEAMKLIKRLV